MFRDRDPIKFRIREIAHARFNYILVAVVEYNNMDNDFDVLFSIKCNILYRNDI